jgi:ABC-type proline/glycine betaine transport system substrate-binding protein
MQDTDAGPMAAARAFLHEQPEVWSAWLDDETAARVRAGLE